MSPEQKQRREAILQADDKDQYAVVELLSSSYVEDFPDDAYIWVKRANALTILCRYEEADSALEFALQHANEELLPHVWISHGKSFERRGHFQEAEHCFLRANEIKPNTSWILMLLAHRTWLRGDLNLAEQRFRDALAVEGEERDEALFNFGGVLVALGRLEEAADCYREALELSPDYEIAQFRLEDVERALELSKTNEAAA